MADPRPLRGRDPRRSAADAFRPPIISPPSSPPVSGRASSRRASSPPVSGRASSRRASSPPVSSWAALFRARAARAAFRRRSGGLPAGSRSGAFGILTLDSPKWSELDSYTRLRRTGIGFLPIARERRCKAPQRPILFSGVSGRKRARRLRLASQGGRISRRSRFWVQNLPLSPILSLLRSFCRRSAATGRLIPCRRLADAFQQDRAKRSPARLRALL